MRSLPIYLMFLFVAAPLFADTLHIPSEYSTIQEAILAAEPGDQLLVAPGTYTENLDFLGKDIILESSDGPEVTVIDGSDPAIPGQGSVVLFQNNESADAVLRGFTLTGGAGTLIGENRNGGAICCILASHLIEGNIIISNTALYGGGICCHGAGTAPTIRNNRIGHNQTQGGGGVYCAASTFPTIERNRVFSNYASICGGGLYSSKDAMPVVRWNTVYGNTAEWSGGGINCYNSSPVIDRNVFYENFAGKRGGAVRYNSDYAEVVGNLIYHNTAGYGGGITCGNSLIANNTIYGNVGLGFGGGATFNSDSTIEVVNTVFWNNDAPKGEEICLNATLGPSTLTMTHSIVDEGQAKIHIEPGSTFVWGAGMMEDEPGFADAANRDFHLLFGAACRDAGDNACPGMQDTDFEGDPRIAFNSVDIGADEFHPHFYCMGDFVPSGSIEGKVIGLPDAWPVGVFLGSALLDPPLVHNWGLFHLDSPWVLFGPMGPLPPDGILTIPAQIPATPSGPYPIYMQALIEDTLSNLFVLDVQ